VRRREKDPMAEVPAELVEYVPKAWRDRGGVDGWIAARWAWASTHGWPDPVELIRGHAEAKRRTAMGSVPRTSLN
jgi:hypothetical protein